MHINADYAKFDQTISARLARKTMPRPDQGQYALCEPVKHGTWNSILFPPGDGSDIQDYLQQVTGGRTVPRVFVKGKFIGGGTEVKALQDQGKLVPMLKNSGAL